MIGGPFVEGCGANPPRNYLRVSNTSAPVESVEGFCSSSTRAHAPYAHAEKRSTRSTLSTLGGRKSIPMPSEASCACARHEVAHG